jgi:hypothetical protein
MTGILSALGAATVLDISIVVTTISFPRTLDDVIGGKEDLAVLRALIDGGVLHLQHNRTTAEVFRTWI